ncbi:general substrate transporter [Periconia macrospinosa]|uniref:General substrate transporter n=1 Tax=Periconia macrospinosa TaxID=97972 RepID=A0A2V1DJK3_9PLEO|nr:general substrate transporter [Periconia macrospinosa]
MTRHRIISEHATRYNYFCAIFVGIGSLLWGYDSGIFATAQAQEYFSTFFHPSTPVLGAIISTYTVGGAIGCLLSWPIGNWAGRRGTMRVGAIVAIVGCTLQTAAQEIGMLITGRLIAGLAVGIIYFAVPQYQSEIAPPEHRGSIVGLHAQFIGTGYAVSNWVGFAYRFPVGLQILWAVILLAGTAFLPESPRFLIETGKTEQAYTLMKRFRKASQEEFVKKEFVQMRDQIVWEKENEESSLLAILRKPSYRKRLVLGCFIQIGQQICGASAINYYQTIMYKSLGVEGATVLALAGVWGTIGPLANLFCLAFIIDRVKRRTMLIWGSVGLGLDIAIVMIFVAVFGGVPNKVANAFGIFFLLMFGIIFSVSWNSGAPVYCTEIFPTQIRATGGALATFWSFIIQVVLAQASPTALENVGWRYYIFFIVMNLVTALGVYFFVPETLGKSLEEINEVFGDELVTVHLDEDVAKEKLDQAVHVERVASA